MVLYCTSTGPYKCEYYSFSYLGNTFPAFGTPNAVPRVSRVIEYTGDVLKLCSCLVVLLYYEVLVFISTGGGLTWQCQGPERCQKVQFLQFPQGTDSLFGCQHIPKGGFPYNSIV